MCRSLKTISSVIIAVVCSFSVLYAANSDKYANTPNYELASRFSAKRVSQMVFSTRIRPIWFKNSNKFWYKWTTSEGSKYYIVDPEKGKKTEIFDMERLAMQLTNTIRDPFDARHIPFRNLELRDDKVFTFEIKSTIDTVDKKDSTKTVKKIFRFEYDLKSKELRQIKEREEIYPEWASISPDGKIGVFVKGSNLFYMDTVNLKKAIKNSKDSTLIEHRLTKDGFMEFSWGTNNYRGNTEEDSTKRFAPDIVWSPDSKHFATMKWDMRPVKNLWVINSVAKPRPTLQTYKYQMPGEPGPKGYLYVFSMPDGKASNVAIQTFKDQDVNLLYAKPLQGDVSLDYKPERWLGDENSFWLYRISRDIKKVDLCRVDIGADSVKTVIKERLNTYVEFRSPHILKNGNIIFWSERNGWANLYLFDKNGKLLKNLTEGAFHVEDVLSVTDNNIIFSACGVEKDENPYQMHTYSVPISGGTPKLLDIEDMDVLSYPSFDGKYIVANYSRVDYAPAVALFQTSNGKQIMDLEEADLSLLINAGYKFPERFKVKAADGVTDLYGVMYKPYDFDSTKVYPIADYVYPGPQVEANNISWSKNFTRTDRLAQIGMIVITVGNRGGHPNRSKWYHNYGYGNLRDYGLEDQKYAIQQLGARYPFIDLSRVGIHGHSGGGFMSTAAILKYPDFFKVAVSCAGNHDNSIYNRWWSEQHHGILEKINKGDTTFVYKIDTNQELAKNLKGHLMLWTGDIDDNVNPANTIRVVDALIRANKRFDLMVLPGQRHGFGSMNEYFFWRMADYYAEWLLGNSNRGQVDIIQMNND